MNHEKMIKKQQQQQKKLYYFGQDPNVLMALVSNMISWFFHRYLPISYVQYYLVPKIEQELIIATDQSSLKKNTTADNTGTSSTTDNSDLIVIDNDDDHKTRCIVIGRPGGTEQMRCITLKNKYMVTCGYNLQFYQKNQQKQNQQTQHNDMKYSTITPDLRYLNQKQQQLDHDEGNNINEKNERQVQEQQQGGIVHVPVVIPPNCALLRIHAFAINYADCCIRWGLYESANEYVGYPIVPGFDIAGMIEEINSTSTSTTSTTEPLQVGDAVFGCTLFGGYSTRVIVPLNQIRRIPTQQQQQQQISSFVSTEKNPTSIPMQQEQQPKTINRRLTMVQAAAVPAVALTSLYALYLAGLYQPQLTTTKPTTSPEGQQQMKSTHDNTKHMLLYRNRSILIYSAAGGVGSMLVRMSKILGLYPIVGVVGQSNKVQSAKQYGCDTVIDQSQYVDGRNSSGSILPESFWIAIRAANTTNDYGLYQTILDANGIRTLQHSYELLSPTGKLIIYGFHTNLPKNIATALSPYHWYQMATQMYRMPKFDPMDLVSTNKSIIGFNLSFLDKETVMMDVLMNQIVEWIQYEPLFHTHDDNDDGDNISGGTADPIVTFPMDQIHKAHELIQSGTTIGKIVMTTPYYQPTNNILQKINIVSNPTNKKQQ